MYAQKNSGLFHTPQVIPSHGELGQLLRLVLRRGAQAPHKLGLAAGHRQPTLPQPGSGWGIP